MGLAVDTQQDPVVLDQEQDVYVVQSEKVTRVNTLAALRRKVLRLLLNAQPDFFNFIRSHLDWHKINEFETRVIAEATAANLQKIDNISQSMLITLHRFNDVRRLNKYFIDIHKRLKRGGYFAGRGETLGIHRKKISNRFGGFAGLARAGHFLYARVLPKLPWVKKIYFALSKGKNRAFSKAEVLGRLYYCGFEVIAVAERGEDFFFLARKVKEPCTDTIPSYGPIIKLKRIGHNGRHFYVYKFRTMHPYSEYLQEYVYKNNQLSENGKFKKDFRIAHWGRFLRRYWLDELPQIVNVFRGEIRLVGVRALSEQYFSLYPTSLQEIRKQYKPGLIPPYYVDLPTSFTEILASEQRYFERKSQNLFTDNIYFAKAVYNILVKNARSL